mgnify:CR=1 FL=1
MKIIAIGAVTAGGKTTLVNAIKDKLTRTASRSEEHTSELQSP